MKANNHTVTLSFFLALTFFAVSCSDDSQNIVTPFQDPLLIAFWEAGLVDVEGKACEEIGGNSPITRADLLQDAQSRQANGLTRKVGAPMPAPPASPDGMLGGRCGCPEGKASGCIDCDGRDAEGTRLVCCWNGVGEGGTCGPKGKNGCVTCADGNDQHNCHL